MNPADGGIAQQSISRKYLHDEVAGRLRALIQAGELKPQERLNEGKLAARFGISRTPLREAIKMLAAEGLVELLPNRGAVVLELSIKDISETFETISGLEAMSGEFACARVTNEEVNEIRALHFEMLACHALRDLPGYYRLNQMIHDAINKAARNDVLRQTYTTINSRLQALRFRSNFDRDKWDAAVREHSEMIEALDARDGRRLAGILKVHVLNKRDCVLAQIAVAAEVNAR